MMPEDIGAPKGHCIYQLLLQSDKARFVGDRIAFIIAETRAQTRDAADRLRQARG
jgi:aerobic carbon-monoxide dehydrogenase large subunit